MVKPRLGEKRFFADQTPMKSMFFFEVSFPGPCQTLETRRNAVPDTIIQGVDRFVWINLIQAQVWIKK